MLYIRPDYFYEFRCTAGKCLDTCCSGWQIMIDEDSIEKYKKIKSDYIWTLMAYVDWEEGSFRQDNKKRCAFLNAENLCELYKNMGEDTLCKTCKEYPRHTEEFEDVREITLSASCPEVARILLERRTPVVLIKEESSMEEETLEFEEFDPFLYSIIEDSRDVMLEMLQNRELPIRERATLVLAMAHDMQRRINRQEMFSCIQVIEKYKTSKAKKYVHDYLKTKDAEESFSLQMFSFLHKLETLRKDWNRLLRKSQEELFFSKEEGYDVLKNSFNQWKRENAEMEIHLEQILIYFLCTYYAGAVYDGKLFAKVQMAVYDTWMIELLWMARWKINGYKLEKYDKIELLYRFSREIEHSDDNLEKLEKIMEKKWLL